ncbi:hypothetical protein O59_003231 [Cellvibrio sp. BR]|nr:hypothetical protein O59_003231 [Cellvibrio sp. BR]
MLWAMKCCAKNTKAPVSEDSGAFGMSSLELVLWWRWQL